MSTEVINPPTKKQIIILRIMIITGLGCMLFFIYNLLNKSLVGCKPLYWLLISTFVYTLFKVIYEWYHYWSISVPVIPPVTQRYTVDVFTTFCAGEPYEMIEETLTAVQAITYPHETYLCDEADDPYLKNFCEKIGVHHVTRTIKINAKAGNINNALQQSKGELCVVLDPDHIPVPEFLDPIVSNFDNPEIGFVQVVQAYYNHDESWIAKGAAQQTYQFYGPMMMTMNSYGTVQAIGANCTFRRTALESIGGHAAGLAEDMHTAMQLHAKGWKSVYVPAVLTRGLVPSTLSAYYKQQLKWSRGVFELLVTSYVKLFKQFSWRQKLHYGLIPLFYLSGVVFLINFLVPVVSLFTGLYPLRIDFSVFLVITVPFITSIVLIRHYVQRWVMEDNERGFHIVGGLLLIGTWWVFILGFLYTIFRKKVPYIPTPKDTRDEQNLKINLPNIFVLIVSIAAIIYSYYIDWNPFSICMAGIVGLNCMFMVFVIVASEELKLQPFIRSKPALSTSVTVLRSIKSHFWIFRRRVYFGVRSIALMLLVLSICISMYINYRANNEDANAGFYSYKNEHLLSFVPQNEAKPFIDALFVKSTPISKLKPFILPVKLVKDSTLIPGVDTDTLVSRNPVFKPNYLLSAHGVGYNKALFWYQNIYPLAKKMIVNDFTEIKSTGLNSVKIYGPTIYDKPTLEAAHTTGLTVYYSFWIPKSTSFVNNDGILDFLSNRILSTVNKFKNNSQILAWNLADDAFQDLDEYYKPPQLYYARYKYTVWLRQLVAQIKRADPSRPVTIELLASPKLSQTVALLHGQIPQIDAFGLIVKSREALKEASKGLNIKYFLSNADPSAFHNSVFPGGGVFYTNWQDQQTGYAITFDGLKDIWGRNKPYLYQIAKKSDGRVPANNLPYIKILKPALTAAAGEWLPFNALVYEYNKWNLAAYIKTGLNFEWYMVKTDSWGNPVSMTKVGSGAAVNIQVPENMARYRLYLIASKGNNITNAYSTLNIPLDQTTE